jgi:hypothetical protein
MKNILAIMIEGITLLSFIIVFMCWIGPKEVLRSLANYIQEQYEAKKASVEQEKKSPKTIKKVLDKTNKVARKRKI